MLVLCACAESTELKGKSPEMKPHLEESGLQCVLRVNARHRESDAQYGNAQRAAFADADHSWPKAPVRERVPGTRALPSESHHRSPPPGATESGR